MTPQCFHPVTLRQPSGIAGGRFDALQPFPVEWLTKEIEAIGRNPAAKDEIGAFIWIGFAVTEAIALFALIMAFIILAG